MNYIIEYDNALEPTFCDSLIDFFNKSEKKKLGITLDGKDTHVKNTMDLHFSDEFDTDFLKNADKILFETTNMYIQTYLNDNIAFINLGTYTDSGYQIQFYKKGNGFYKYHCDEHINIKKNEYRILTYLYYLNDVEEGGETGFNGDKIMIKPKKGKLVIFPSSCLFPHRALTPISGDKYIITGWLYSIIPYN
jgi:Rps23 Pro-64 3,4-dihydroxylase Tpa1-like proline 4-hydroxylase